jgi:hypothetical protein
MNLSGAAQPFREAIMSNDFSNLKCWTNKELHETRGDLTRYIKESRDADSWWSHGILIKYRSAVENEINSRRAYHDAV